MNLKESISAAMAAVMTLSMATVPAFAAAVDPVITGHCAICNKAVGTDGVASEGQTYQEYFSVDTISGLKNSGSVYLSHNKLNTVTYNGRLICYDCLEEKINEYKASHPSLDQSSDQSSSTDITASVPSSYTIVVPQTVAMIGEAGTGEKTATVSVTVKGDIPEDQAVTVSSIAPVMKREGSGDVTAKVTSPKTTWNRTELLNTGTKSDYTVAATLTPGSWSGVMTFSCSLA